MGIIVGVGQKAYLHIVDFFLVVARVLVDLDETFFNEDDITVL